MNFQNEADLNQLKKVFFDGIRFFIFIGFPIGYFLLQVLYVRTVSELRSYLWLQFMGAILWWAMMTLYDQAKEILDLKNKLHRRDFKVGHFPKRDFTIDQTLRL